LYNLYLCAISNKYRNIILAMKNIITKYIKDIFDICEIMFAVNIFCHPKKCSIMLMAHSDDLLFINGHPGIISGSWVIMLKLSPKMATNKNNRIVVIIEIFEIFCTFIIFSLIIPLSDFFCKKVNYEIRLFCHCGAPRSRGTTK